MKKAFSLLLSCWLLVFLSVHCCGAVPPKSSPSQLGNLWYSKTATWYSIKPDQPSADWYYQSSPPGFSVFGGEYYRNEQTFADLFFQNVGSSNLNYFAGSYLFERGFFIGLRYMKNAWNETTLSPGYRFKVGNQGYAAVSFDYVSNDNSNPSEIAGYDLDFKFYPTKMMIYGGINIPKEGNRSMNINANYQVDKTIVVGAGIQFNDHDHTDYNAGFTYKANSLITDFQFGNRFNQNYYQLDAMYHLKKYGIGLLYQKYENDHDPEITLQGLYNLPKAKLVFKHAFQNDSYEQLTSLAYQMKL